MIVNQKLVNIEHKTDTVAVSIKKAEIKEAEKGIKDKDVEKMLLFYHIIFLLSILCVKVCLNLYKCVWLDSECSKKFFFFCKYFKGS